MSSGSLRYFLILLVILAAIIIGTSLFINSIGPKTSPSAGTPTQSAPNSTSQSTATLTLTRTAHATVIAQWAYLPGDTVRIDIFRSPKNKNLWEKWLSINLPQQGAANGTAEFHISPNENLSAYAYYFQTITSSGTASFTSPVITPVSFSPGEHISFSTPPATPQTTTSSAPTSQPQSTSSPALFPSPSQTPPTSPSSSIPSPQSAPPGAPSGFPTSSVSRNNTGTYYTPQIIPSGSGTQDANFWVLHVNQNIEIGWQNLPSSTDMVIVLRAQSENGPWTTLLEQKNPSVSDPYFIRILDESITATYYYLMRAFRGGTIVQSYGPLMLAGIAQ